MRRQRIPGGILVMLDKAFIPRVSIFMPTFEHARFIARAIESLLAQSLPHWELIIVDDGSCDGTAQVIGPYLCDQRIRYHRLQENQGLGAALNLALDRSRAAYIAYLPADDVYYRDHLASLLTCMEANPDAVLAYSGVRHHYNRTSAGQIEGYPLQLVQCLHQRGEECWTERRELITDDLERMFWAKLRAHGMFAASGQVRANGSTTHCNDTSSSGSLSAASIPTACATGSSTRCGFTRALATPSMRSSNIAPSASA